MSATSKKSAAPDAALGACVHFAAAVLTTTASPSLVCTKDALSAIVVEAHRFGQQVARSDVGIARDPRKLLKKLQRRVQSDAAWHRPGVLDVVSLAFEDVTWDAQGVVRQTLEIELLELEMRAREARRSVCVLLRLRAPSGECASVEHALLWLPESNYHSTKRQYLLYVRPGRVKVVKSVGELLKKLYDEVRALKDSDAVYNVWTLSQADVAAGTTASLSDRRGAVESNQERDDEPRRKSSQPEVAVSATVRQSVDVPSKVEYQQQPPIATAASASHRVMRIQPALKSSQPRLSSYDSIFCFAIEPQPHESTIDTANQTVLSEPLAEMPEKQGDETSALETFAYRHEDAERRSVASTPVRQLTQDALPRSKKRHVLAASYSNGQSTSTARHAVDHEQQAQVWQSLESNLKKPVLKSRRPSVDTRGEIAQLTVAAFIADTEQSASQPSISSDAAAVDLCSERQHAFSTRKIVVKDVETSSAPAPSIFTFLDSPPSPSPQRCREPRQHSACEEPQDPQPDSLLDEATDSIESSPSAVDASFAIQDPVSCSPVDDQSTGSACSDQAVDAPPVAPQRRMNYRAKLGNRVWWELQCAADKLLSQQQQQETSTHKRRNEATRAPGTSTAKQSMPIAFKQPPAPACDGTSLAFGKQAETRVPSHNESSSRSRSGGVRPVSPTPHSTVPSTELSRPDDPNRRALAAAHEMQSWSREENAATTVSRSTSSLGKTDDRPSQSAVLTATAPPAPLDCVRPKTKEPLVLTESPSVQSPHLVAVAAPVYRSDSSAFALPTGSRTSEHLTSARQSVVTARLSDAYTVEYAQVIEAVAFAPREHQPRASSERAGRAPERAPGHPVRPYSTRTSSTSSSDNDDDDVVKDEWASTRTSYAAERQPSAVEAESVHASLHDGATEVPFSVCGRVPIRSACAGVAKRHEASGADDIAASNDPDRDDTNSMLSAHRPARQPPAVQRPDAWATSAAHDRVEVAPPVVASTAREQQHVATFIAFDADTTTTASKQHAPGAQSTAASLLAREAKLAGLRQKKLQQLHRAREAQQQQLQNRKTPKSSLTATPVDVLAPGASASAVHGGGGGILSATHMRAAKRPSNRKLIQNALEYTLLAGASMARDRAAALEALAHSPCDNFIVLLKSARELKFRALYEHHTDRDEVVRLFATTPKCPLTLAPDVIGQLFKYNSGKKEFVAIDSRAFTMKTDACALTDELVFRKKPLSKLL